jgi:activating signal cointegrator complex subunit 2
MAPRQISPLLPSRRNIYDNDEFDRLAVDTLRLHLGRRNPDRTADEILKDRSNAPSKAAILSALAAFDSNDDERDDTYDVEDVGGTVDSVAPGNTPEDANAGISETTDEALFRAFKMTPGVFDRDATTRRSRLRLALKEETGMTDEVIEGWSLILLRDPQRMRRLEAKFSSFSGVQRELAATSWRVDDGASGNDESDSSGRGKGDSKGRGRGGRSGRGQRDVANPTTNKETEIARRRKEANKGLRANHNRRDQRAKKMARGGFPV